ncbi:MAG: TonB-dependent receptor [Bryobacteraceae bacterium]|jgi:outer membrane cobalamin receptor
MQNVHSLVFLSLAAAALACASEGVVVDPSGRPIQHARVACAGLSAETEASGHFSIEIGGPCRATVSASGFETKQVELVPATPAHIQLAIASRSERVVVTATRHETDIAEAGAASSVITAADLQAQDYPSLADTLREVPGIQVVQSGRPGSLTDIYGRGGQYTAMLVLVDGVPMNDPGGAINLAGDTTTGIERIEVVRGPESAVFGADASSGVIQLFTKRGDAEGRVPHGDVSYERGSFGTDRWTADLSGGSGARLDYALTAAQFHSEGEYPNDFFRDTSGTADVGFRITPNTQVRGIFRTFDAATGTPNQVGYGIFDYYGSEDTRDSLVSAAVDDVRGAHFVQHFSFGYHRSNDVFYEPVNQGPYNVAAYVQDVGNRVYFEGLANPAAPVPPGLTLVTASPFDTAIYASPPYLSLSSRTDFAYQGTLTYTGGATVFGYQYERQDADIGGSNVGRDNHSVFLEEQYTVSQRLFLSAGIRYEQNSAFHTKIAPRGAASYRLAGSTWLRASAGIGFVEPSLLENYSQESYALGNPALRPEKTVSYDAGLIREWFARRLETEVSAFDNSFQDLIVYVYPTWQNIEASHARGLEFSSRMKIAPWLTASGGYTRMWTRITSSNTPDSIFLGVGQEIARQPGNAGTLSMTLAPRRWTLQAGAILVGERQDPDPYIFGVTRNRGYQNVYATGSFRLNKHLTPFVRGANLLNQDYMEVLGYPALSRSVYGGLRLEW